MDTASPTLSVIFTLPARTRVSAVSWHLMDVMVQNFGDIGQFMKCMHLTVTKISPEITLETA